MATDRGTGDLSFALRTLARNPGFAAVVIATLAIGIGGTTAVFSAVDAVLLQPAAVLSSPGSSFALYQNDVAPPGRPRLRHARSLSRVSRRDVVVRGDGGDAARTARSAPTSAPANDVRRIRLLPVSADYFDVVRVHPEIGRGFQRDEENGASVVVVSHALWEEQLAADPAAVGKTLTMNGTPYTVAGVMPDGFADPIAGASTPGCRWTSRPAATSSNVDNHYLTVIARLRPT